MPPSPLHPAALEPAALAAACEVRFSRRSGPGGQNRNKVETAVILTHRPTRIRAEASERRSQGENLKAAVFRLRLNLALAIRREVAPEEPTSDLWRARCRGRRLDVSPDHDDFPALLAEALDRLDSVAMDVKPAALALGCSTTQLVRFLKGEPRAFLLVNKARDGKGMHPLK